MSDILPLNLIEGGTARIEARLLDSAGIPVAPGDVRLLLLEPNATESYEHTVSVSGDTVVAVIPLTLPGTWRYRFETTTEPYAVEESYFNVTRRQVPLLGFPGGTAPAIHTNWRIGELTAAGFVAPTDILAISRIDGATETSHKITVAQLRDMAVNLITQTPTGFFFESEGARINRMNDRVFIGRATANDGTTLGGGVGADWFSAGTGVAAGVGWVHYAASVALTVPSGKVGFAAASRASDVPVGYGSTQTSIPFVGVAVMDRTGVGPPYWTSYGAYLEGRIEGVSSAIGTVIGLEIDAINFGGPVEFSTPWRMQTTGGATSLWLASGGDPGNHGRAISPAQLALGIVDNGETFMAGLVFGRNAIEGTDGLSGFGHAISLSTRHLLSWYAQGGGDGERVSYITSTNTVPGHSLQFQDGATLFLSAAGKIDLAIGNVANSVNGMGLVPATAGNSPYIETFGDDAAPNLDFKPKGAGNARLFAQNFLFMADDGNQLAYVQAQVSANTYEQGLIFADGGPFFYGRGSTIVGFGMVASAVNHLSLSNSATGNAVSITAQGTDSDIDILLDPAGSAGTLKLAVPTATSANIGGASALPGVPATYFIVKDGAGTAFKIPGWNL